MPVKRYLKKYPLIAIVLLVVLGYVGQRFDTASDGAPRPAAVQGAGQADAILAEAMSRRQSDLQVSGEGVVIKLLADDNHGSRHQRFIIELASGQTLLVAHNIDLAPRIDALRVGDRIQFNGEYEWNDKGGVLHWTHHDPQGRHEPGWLRHRGTTYQ